MNKFIEVGVSNTETRWVNLANVIEAYPNPTGGTGGAGGGDGGVEPDGGAGAGGGTDQAMGGCTAAPGSLALSLFGLMGLRRRRT